MDFRIKRRELPRVEITALIDIVFLLVIFLMISTTFKKKEKLVPNDVGNSSPKHDISLPESSTQILIKDEKSVEIWVNKDGKFFVDERELSLQEIKTTMADSVSMDEEVSVIVKGDKEVNLDKVVELMDLASEMKIKHFSLGMSKPASENK